MTSHESPQAETKPQSAHNEAEPPQELAGTRVSSAAADSIPSSEDLIVFTDDVDTSSSDAVDGTTPISGCDPQDLLCGRTPDSPSLNLSGHSPQESSEITNVSNETNTVNQDNYCQSSGDFSQVEDTSERQLPNTANDETGSAGSPGAHDSSDVKCVSGARSWADSIKSTASSVSPSVNRGCLEGSGPAVSTTLKKKCRLSPKVISKKKEVPQCSMKIIYLFINYLKKKMKLMFSLFC